MERRPVAVSDVASLLGVSINTVNAWRKRAAGAKQVEPFPPAVGKVAGIDYWWEDEVLAWARRTGRVKAASDEPSAGHREGTSTSAET